MAEVRMTEEIRQKMLGLLPFDNEATVEFTPAQYEGDFPEEYKPIFIQRGYKEGEMKAVRELLKKLDKAEDEEMTEQARISVVGWENLWDVGSMKEIPYKSNGNGASPEVFNKLPTVVKGALLFNAVRISGLLDLDKLALKS